MKHSGQISLIIALVGAGGMIIASAFTAWATSNKNTTDIRAQISVVEERESNHFRELERRLDMMDKKIDKLLERK